MHKGDYALIFGGFMIGASLAWFVNMPRDDYVCWVPNNTPDIVTVSARELRRDAPMVFVRSGERTLWIHRSRLNVCEEVTK